MTVSRLGFKVMALCQPLGPDKKHAPTVPAPCKHSMARSLQL
jgi:hypothetical protein